MLTLHYNAIAAVKNKLQDGNTSNLTADAGFRKHERAWRDYQTKWVARHKRMGDSPRTAPVHDAADVFTLNPQLITSRTEKCATLSCQLLPEKESAGAQNMSFADLYERRCKDYNSCNWTKVSSENLANYLLLVRMEIQYLAGCDVEWKSDASASAGPAALLQPNAAADASQSKAAAPAGMSLSLVPLAPADASSKEGSIARGEAVLLSHALRISIRDSPISSNHGEVLTTPSPAADAGPADAVTSTTDSAFDFSNISAWGYKRGEFPLTPEALGQMRFEAELKPPKHVFAAALLLFVCSKRNEEEEAAFTSLSGAWEEWFHEPLSYAFLKKGPPSTGRLAHSEEEINWYMVRHDCLVKQITSEQDRARLGLPQLPAKGKGSVAAQEAAALLVTNPRGPAVRNATPAAESPAGSQQCEAPIGVGTDSELEGGFTLPAPAKRGSRKGGPAGAAAPKRRRVVVPQADADSVTQEHGAAAAASPARAGETEQKTIEKNGKLVSAKDGRIVAAGNDLKVTFHNNYRNADNQTAFYGKFLTLGEAFKLACIVQYGPALPIEASGNTSMRTALFLTAAHYALTKEETSEIMRHTSFADFLYFHVLAAKQLKYSYYTESKLYFGEIVFSRHRPSPAVQGTSNVISSHCVVTMFSNLKPRFFDAAHLGMDQDIPFLNRPAWRKQNSEEGRYLVLCPLSAATEKRRASKANQTPGMSARSSISRNEKSALFHQYDLELHQMIAYMRRLDGACKNSKGRKCMNPFAPDGAEKWSTFGNKIPLFGYWAYVAWENVFCPVFSKSFGQIVSVTNQRSLERLLGAEVMM